MRLRMWALAMALAAVLIPLAITHVPLARGAGFTAVGRQSRGSGIAVAGANIYVWSSSKSETSGGGCTLAFIVRSRSSHALGALTAGHCVRTIPGGPPFLVHQTQRRSSNGTDPGLLLGTVGRGAARLGKEGDSAFVRLAAHRGTQARVFVGPVFTSRSIPVVGVMPVRAGETVCYSGAATGEHCGYRVVGPSGTGVFREGNRVIRIQHEWRATRSSCTSRRGDSGSPVYVRKGNKAYAVGLLSGGQSAAGRCPFFFTPVTLALHTLNLRLVRS